MSNHCYYKIGNGEHLEITLENLNWFNMHVLLRIGFLVW